MDSEHQALLRHIQSSLRHHLAQCKPAPRQLIVGFSGGVDSTVLLHALAQAESLPPVHAVHIHHGLQTAADDWQQHCAQVCAQLDIPFSTHAVIVARSSRSSLEANARDARYARLFSLCHQQQAALVLGQHQDDQLETFLLQAKRGSGPAGLAGMAPVQWRQQVATLRPLLDVSRSEIEGLANAAGLAWIEDGSNQDERHERNFLRHRVVPLLKQRWPAVAKTVSRSARLCAEQQALLEETSAEHLAAVSSGNILAIGKLVTLSAAWQRQVLRSWIQQCGGRPPSAQRLAEIERMLHARSDSQPQVTLDKVSIRRAFNHLYWVVDKPLPPDTPQAVAAHNTLTEPWLIRAFTVNQTVQIQSNMPAVTLRLQRQGVSKKLKDWMRQWQVPAWQRAHCPVVFIDDQPVAIILADEVKYCWDAPVSLKVTLV